MLHSSAPLDLANEASTAAFKKLWPIAKMPVLRDDARDRTIPESSIIIEYLAQHYPGRTALIPTDSDLALRTRLGDRFYDLYVHDPMQRIVGDRLRPAGKNDPHGVDTAKAMLRTAYDMIDGDMASRTWAMGDAFTMAHVARYFERLTKRPSFARTLAEAEPYLKLFPG